MLRLGVVRLLGVYLVNVKVYVISALISAVISAVGYFAQNRLNERAKRKIASYLGVAILSTLVEEVKTGISVMEDIKNRLGTNSLADSIPLLPTASWIGRKTINDDVLLRILAIFVDQQDDDVHGFPSQEILIHCKNYFQHICVSINSNIRALNTKGLERQLLSQGNFIEAAKGVEAMLDHTRDGLQKNAQKMCPK